MSNLPDPGHQHQYSFSLPNSTTGHVMLSPNTELHSYASADADPGSQPGQGSNVPAWVNNLSVRLNNDINTYNNALNSANRGDNKGKSTERDSALGTISQTVGSMQGYIPALTWPPATAADQQADETHYVSPPFALALAVCTPPPGWQGAVTFLVDRSASSGASWGFVTNFGIAFWRSQSPKEGPPSSSSVVYSSSSSSTLREDP